MSGERHEEKQKIALSLVSKNTNPVFRSLVFAQVSSGSGLGKEGEFCAQVGCLDTSVCKYQFEGSNS